MKHMICQLSVVLVLATTLSAEVDRRGTTAGNFLLLQPGAASTALGGTGVSMPGDATAFWWNPAMASTFKTFSSSYSTTRLYADVDFHMTSVIFPILDRLAIGAYLDFVPIGSMERTTLLEPDGTGDTFDAENMAIALGLGWQLTDRVHVGASIKSIKERIWLEEATGWAIDMGSYFRLEEAGFALGMTLSNFGPDMQMDGVHLSYHDDPPETTPGAQERSVQLITGEFALPAAFRLGCSLDLMNVQSLFYKNRVHRVTLSATLEDRIDAPFRTNWGLEYGWNRAVFLRGGFRGNHDTAGASLGAGVLIPVQSKWLLGCDFAWTDSRDLGDVLQWTISLRPAK